MFINKTDKISQQYWVRIFRTFCHELWVTQELFKIFNDNDGNSRNKNNNSM